MSSPTVTKRFIRRELHSSRSAAVSVLLGLTAVVLLWIGLEIVLRLMNFDPLLIAPAALLAFITAPAVAWAPLIGFGLIVLGIIAIVLGFAPGRKGKHLRASDTGTMLVDDRLIAAAISERVANEVGTSREHVRTSVGRRSAEIIVTPVSGIRVDREHLQRAVDQEISSYQLEPSLSARIRLSQKGTVGA
ncbi:hypothetical protein [Humidisolicoccus flavus]|uniref:hypothetical protein n=1 Tax=Humidisolicoccus flavus TaxID=3111414 RepID=UPI003255EF22